MQGTRVRALVREDPTCRGAVKPHHLEISPGRGCGYYRVYPVSCVYAPGALGLPEILSIRQNGAGNEDLVFLDFPGGAVVKNPPANAGDMGSSPGLGRLHMPRSNWAREPQLLSSHATTTEARDVLFEGERLGGMIDFFKYLMCNHMGITRALKTPKEGFPGGSVVENLPANAGDTGSSPGLGRSHMPRSDWAREPQLLSLRVWSLCSATREAAMYCPEVYLGREEILQESRASLVAQWLRILLPIQGTRVQALVREDTTCRGATKPMRHNY
ncbi:hypothetical protein J1605_008075 [Eschrichtius robustus]|uniref:Uncharacterized protein n=1 Tax=Eschrichtius robustus TaxID=9764 RepID=A0AB34GZ63_ESCRO|nr:hypothetical protein J1605_008075 [Eschrichtius robustus]